MPFGVSSSLPNSVGLLKRDGASENEYDFVTVREMVRTAGDALKAVSYTHLKHIIISIETLLHCPLGDNGHSKENMPQIFAEILSVSKNPIIVEGACNDRRFEFLHHIGNAFGQL